MPSTRGRKPGPRRYQISDTRYVLLLLYVVPNTACCRRIERQKHGWFRKYVSTDRPICSTRKDRKKNYQVAKSVRYGRQRANRSWCIPRLRPTAPYVQGTMSPSYVHVANLDACPAGSLSKVRQRTGCPLLQAVLFRTHTQVRHQRRTPVNRTVVPLGVVTPRIVWHCC